MKLKLFKVTNGYVGDGEVYCLVICNSEEEAINKARERYKAVYNDRKKGISNGYPRRYYENLTATMLSNDTSKEYVGKLENEFYDDEEE